MCSWLLNVALGLKWPKFGTGVIVRKKRFLLIIFYIYTYFCKGHNSLKTDFCVWLKICQACVFWPALQLLLLGLFYINKSIDDIVTWLYFVAAILDYWRPFWNFLLASNHDVITRWRATHVTNLVIFTSKPQLSQWTRNTD